MNKETKHGILIYAKPIFDEDLSSSSFFYKYEINIINQSDSTVRLLKRHWEVIEILGDKKEINGEGVVGEMPVINPNESYTYVSGVNSQEPLAFMMGYYTMQNLHTKRLFVVDIPMFELVHPSLLN